MTKQNKELLLKDLCARLPYCVYIGDEYANKWELVGIEIGENTVMFKQQSGENLGITPIEGVKPYLRPMSSMTDKEKVEYCYLQAKFLLSSQYLVTDAYELFDWLNAHHFDVRHLIEKGLAIDCTGLNIY